MSESEEVYREFKADRQGDIGRPVKMVGFRVSRQVVRRRRDFAMTGGLDFEKRHSPAPEDYSGFKATMASFAEEIKLEIRDQHHQTRAEIQTVRHDVLEAVKASPAEYVKLLCELGSLFLVFSLVVRFALKIELVNPAFAVFMLFACALYWSMANVKQRSEKRSKRPQA
jgi:hypothetical protein